MMDDLLPCSRRTVLPLRVGGLALAVAVAAGVGHHALSGPAVLSAGGSSSSSDADGDCLINGSEGILGTDAFEADTDGDGFGDSEELARDSDPLDATSVPTGATASVGLDASAHDQYLHLISTFFVPPTADLSGMDWKIGVLLPNRSLYFLPSGWTNQNSTLLFTTAADPQAALMVVETLVRKSLVHTFGSASFVTTLTVNGQIVDADVIDVLSMEGILVRRIELPNFGGWTNGPGQAKAQVGQQGPWTVFLPLEDEGIPSTWIPGQVCVQETQVVGAAGPSVTNEVVAADCMDGWDGYCSSNCPDSVGETHTTVDPGALIGG